MMKGFIAVGLLLTVVNASAGNKINVMTLNQYLGADLTPVLTASPEAFNDALVAALAQTAKSNMKSRALAQARLIKRRHPDVVALQESWLLSCQDEVPNDSKGCEDPLIADAFNDYLELTLAALNKKGDQYKTAATVKNLDLAESTIPSGIPIIVNGVIAFLNAVDRDVILVKQKIDAVPVSFVGFCSKLSVDGCNYIVAAPAVTPVGPIEVERGFVAVDLTLAGQGYRIFNTHLEVKGEDLGNPDFTFFQAAQAAQLIETVAWFTSLDKNLLLLGDMNSSPVQDDPSNLIVTPYHQFIAANYLDIWDLKYGNKPGYTCCQPEQLNNRRSELYERIDMIFAVQEPIKIKNVRVIGDKASSKTKRGRNGLWFSDHAAVAAKLRF